MLLFHYFGLCIHFVIVECNSIGVSRRDLPRPKGYPLFIALKVISLNIINLRPCLKLMYVGDNCTSCESYDGDCR